MPGKKKLPAPPLTDSGELASYAGDHLVYEVRMFFEGGAELLAEQRRKMSADAVTTATPSVMLGVPAKSWFLKMARIEAFVTHYRNVVVFLFPDTHAVKSDDVCAHHFVSGSDPLGSWLSARGSFSPKLKAAKARADKELAHLTTGRKAGVSKDKAWPVDDLTGELATVLETFVATADPASLGGMARRVILQEVATYQGGARLRWVPQSGRGADVP